MTCQSETLLSLYGGSFEMHKRYYLWYFFPMSFFDCLLIVFFFLCQILNKPNLKPTIQLRPLTELLIEYISHRKPFRPLSIFKTITQTGSGSRPAQIKGIVCVHVCLYNVQKYLEHMGTIKMAWQDLFEHIYLYFWYEPSSHFLYFSQCFYCTGML